MTSAICASWYTRTVMAIIAFLESTDFEDAIRNAISLGGDADTQACIAGAHLFLVWVQIGQCQTMTTLNTNTPRKVTHTICCDYLLILTRNFR